MKVCSACGRSVTDEAQLGIKYFCVWAYADAIIIEKPTSKENHEHRKQA